MSYFDQINTFLNVVEANSFTKAGETLGISATAVSKQIHELEVTIGATLLTRSTRKIAITEIGKICYDRYKTVFGEFKEIENLVSSSQSEPQGLLRVASSIAMSQCMLDHITSFMQQYPKVSIELESFDRVPDLEKENFDFLFGWPLESVESTQSNLVSIPLFESTRILCASPAYLKKYGEPKHPNELSQHAFITHSLRPKGMLLLTEHKPCKLIEIPIKEVFRVNDTRALLASAIKNIGIIQVHNYLTETAIKQKQLKEILSTYREKPTILRMYYLKTKYMPPKITQFKDFMAKKMQK